MTRGNRSKVSAANPRNVRPAKPLPGPTHVYTGFAHILSGGINGRAMEAAQREAAEEAKLKRIAYAYMSKWFGDDREGYPTDAAMTEAFAGCAKRPEPSFYPAIRAAILDEAECMGLDLVGWSAPGSTAGKPDRYQSATIGRPLHHSTLCLSAGSNARHPDGRYIGGDTSVPWAVREWRHVQEGDPDGTHAGSVRLAGGLAESQDNARRAAERFAREHLASKETT